MVFLSKVGLVNVAFLNRNRKYSVLINFIVAAVLTPTPDVVNMVLMAIPLMALYEVGVLAVWVFGRKKLSAFNKENLPEVTEKVQSPDTRES